MTLNLTLDQQLALLRQLLPAAGAILGVLGWVSPDDWSTLEAVILKLTGPMMVFGSAIWTVIANRDEAMIKSVAAMPSTSVSPTGSTITIHDFALSQAAALAATPATPAPRR